jgi:tRNA(fMet)-specific endonuclease VapC
MYMLDTNICIFAIKKRPEKVLARLQTHKPSEICISSITYAELCHGVEKSQAKARNRLALTLFLSAINIMPFDELAANEYGKVRAALLEANGTPIGLLDTQIAAHAKALNMTLVTNNVTAQ